MMDTDNDVNDDPHVRAARETLLLILRVCGVMQMVDYTHTPGLFNALYNAWYKAYCKNTDIDSLIESIIVTTRLEEMAHARAILEHHRSLLLCICDGSLLIHRHGGTEELYALLDKLLTTAQDGSDAEVWKRTREITLYPRLRGLDDNSITDIFRDNLTNIARTFWRAMVLMRTLRLAGFPPLCVYEMALRAACSH